MHAHAQADPATYITLEAAMEQQGDSRVSLLKSDIEGELAACCWSCCWKLAEALLPRCSGRRGRWVPLHAAASQQ